MVHSLLVFSLHSSPGGLHKELSNGAHGLTMEFGEVFKSVSKSLGFRDSKMCMWKFSSGQLAEYRCGAASTWQCRPGGTSLASAYQSSDVSEQGASSDGFLLSLSHTCWPGSRMTNVKPVLLALTAMLALQCALVTFGR